MHKLAVGQPLPSEARHIISNEDGASLQITNDRQMLLFISLAGVRAAEVREVKSGVVQFRIFKSDNIDFLLVGFGKNQYELPFDPTLYTSSLEDVGNGMTIILVERTNATVKVLRMIGLGSNFMTRLKQSWEYARNNKTEFERALSDLYSRTINQNWLSAEVVDWRE